MNTMQGFISLLPEGPEKDLMVRALNRPFRFRQSATPDEYQEKALRILEQVPMDPVAEIIEIHTLIGHSGVYLFQLQNGDKFSLHMMNFLWNEPAIHVIRNPIESWNRPFLVESETGEIISIGGENRWLIVPEGQRNARFIKFLENGKLISKVTG